MFGAWFKIASLILAFGFASTLNVEAQNSACNLELKIFSYNAIASKNSIENVEAVLTNLKSKEKKLLTLLSATHVFENLAEANYRVELSKKGYKTRKKEIKLECGYADKSNVFTVNAHLWRDKSVSVDDSDSQDKIIETKNSANAIVSDKNQDALRPENSDNKSLQSETKASGKVTVRVTIDVDGNIVSAKAVDGKALLAEAAVKAARQSKFAPTMLAGNPVQVTGDIIYNFVP